MGSSVSGAASASSAAAVTAVARLASLFYHDQNSCFCVVTLWSLQYVACFLSSLSKLRQLKKAGAGAAHLSTVVPAHYDTIQAGRGLTASDMHGHKRRQRSIQVAHFSTGGRCATRHDHHETGHVRPARSQEKTALSVHSASFCWAGFGRIRHSRSQVKAARTHFLFNLIF